MDQSFDSSNIDIDIDSLSEPIGFAMGGAVESMHLTPYTPTNQENGDYQDSHSMPMTYSEGGEVEKEDENGGEDEYEIGDYSSTRPGSRSTARDMLQRFADGGSVQGRPVGGMFDLGPPTSQFMSPGMTNATAPGGIGAAQYNKNISDFVTANIHRNPAAITSAAQQYGVSANDITSALGGQTLESKFRAEPAYQTTTVDGVKKDLFGPATMLTGGTGQGASWQAPIVTSRPRMLADVTPTLSASQQHARNLAAGDVAVQQAFQRTGLPMDTSLAYSFQRQLDTGQLTPDQLQAKFDPIAYERRVKEAYKNIGREGFGSDLSAFHPTSMGEMYKAYFNPNASAQELESINQRYANYGSNWNAAQANKARTEVLIPALRAQDYYARNPDVAAAFQAAQQTNPNLDYAKFALDHYNRTGKREGRTWDNKITVGAFEAPKAEDFAKIDPSGYNYWLQGLTSGTIKPQDFESQFYGGVARYSGPYTDLYQGSIDKANAYLKSKGINTATTNRTLPGATGYQYRDQWNTGAPAQQTITNLYETVLGRAPDEAGLQNWMNTIGRDNVITADEIAQFNAAAQAEINARNTYEVPYARGGEVKSSAARMLENLSKKADGAASARMTAPVRRAEGSPEEGEKPEPRAVDQEPRTSAAETMKKLGLSVARGVPQIVTGAVDLAAMPFTLSGMLKPEEVVGSTEYLTKRGLLPPPQKGVLNETAELVGSAVNPAGTAKAALVGMVGPKGIIEAARRSQLFKGRGLEVPSGEISTAEMLKALKEQGVDVDRTWLRGKRAPEGGAVRQIPYETLEAMYEKVQKRPNAQEDALRDAIRSQSREGRTLSRQPGDRSVTKFNTTGGVWLTESPTLAETYSGAKGYMIPVYAPKPGAVLDAKGENWSDFYRKSKEWKEAKADPNIRAIEVRNVLDAGPHWTDTIPARLLDESLSDEKILSLLRANNLFLKKPFNNRVVNKLTGEPFEFKHGGHVTTAFIKKSSKRR